MKIDRFNESKSKSKSEKDEDSAAELFDVKSLDTREEDPTFRTQNEEMPKAAEKKLKKEIQVTTPGLKNSIKKFEEFALVIDLGADTVSGCGCCSACTGEPGCDGGCEDCQCDSTGGATEEFCDACDCSPCRCGEGITQAVKPFGEFSEPFSEKLSYHIENGISVVENVFRPGSKSFVNLITEARKAHDSGRARFMGQDRYLFENTDLGRFAEYGGEMVPLDLPFEQVDEVNEAEYKGKKVELNHPMRGGAKKYYVYVMNPKTKRVKKIAFGDVHGGLTAKVSDPKARKNFASRHNCKDKKDKTKAGYWACRINRFGHLWNGRTYPGYW